VILPVFVLRKHGEH